MRREEEVGGRKEEADAGGPDDEQESIRCIHEESEREKGCRTIATEGGSQEVEGRAIRQPRRLPG